MSKCKRCKINILDDAVMCPLCHGVLYEDAEEVAENETAVGANGEKKEELAQFTSEGKTAQSAADADLLGEDLPGWSKNHASRSRMYPDVEPAMRKMRMVIRVSIFLAIVAECICVLINYLTYKNVKWSLVTGVALLYACFTLIYSVQKNKSHQRKMIGQLVIGVFLVIAIDASLGFSGWSLKYVIPSAIILMDIGFGVLMIINRRNWQSYIMSQIWMIVVSALCMIPTMKHSSDFPLFGVIAVVVSVLSLASSFVFGDKTTESELRRRFHM